MNNNDTNALECAICEREYFREQSQPDRPNICSKCYADETKQDNVPQVKMFRVLVGYDKKDLKNMPSQIPWDMLNEEQAKRNHSQTLSRLNERGGMCVTEILANIYKQSNRDWTVTQETVDELNKLVSDFLKPQEVPQVKTVEEENAMSAEEIDREYNEAYISQLEDAFALVRSRNVELEASNNIYKKQITELNSHLDDERRVKDRVKLKLEATTRNYRSELKEFAELNKSLEASNAKYREALEGMIDCVENYWSKSSSDSEQQVIDAKNLLEKK